MCSVQDDDKNSVWIGVIDYENLVRDMREQTEMHVASSKEAIIEILRQRIAVRDDADVDDQAIVQSLQRAGFAEKDDFEYCRFNYHIYKAPLNH